MATFAFIHGAGDVGWYWHLVEAELQARGHDTVAPDLPIEDDDAGLEAYAATVVDAIGDRHDVAVVAQSFGGYVAPLVAERIAARLIVLVAAMIPSPGESAEDMFANTRWEPEHLVDSSDIAVFYHDVPRALADEALSHGRRQSDTPGREPWPLGAWPAIETRFVLCRNDRFFPAPLAPATGPGPARNRARRDRQRTLPRAEPPARTRRAPRAVLDGAGRGLTTRATSAGSG